MDSETYHLRIKEWVQREVHKKKSFEDILTALPGVDPIVVRDAILQLYSITSDSRYEDYIREIGTIKHNGGPRKYGADEIVPHPLDFDWRFSSKAVEHFLETIKQAENVEHIVLLGTPTLAVAFEIFLPQISVTLIDKNVLWNNQLKKVNYIQFDIMREEIPEALIHSADIVIVDPPWYMEHFVHFVWLGSRVLRTDGLMFMSVPAIGTRPGVVTERHKLNEFVLASGFEASGKTEKALPYEMSPFENNAFVAAGVYLEKNDWRSGDIWIYKKQREQSNTPDRIDASLEWNELNIGGVRIKFSSSEVLSERDALLESILPNDILPSVSVRHPLRKTASIWTSGNRIFRSSNPQRVYQLLQNAYFGGYINSTNRDEDLVIDKLRLLIEQEKKEYILGRA